MDDDFSFLDNEFVDSEEASKPDPKYDDLAETGNLLDPKKRLKESVIQDREDLDGRLRTMGYSIYDRPSEKANSGGYGGGGGGYGAGGGYGGGGGGGYSGGGYGGGVPRFGGGGLAGAFKGFGAANSKTDGEGAEDFAEVENDDGNIEVLDDDEGEGEVEEEEVDNNQFLDSIEGSYGKIKRDHEEEQYGFSTKKDDSDAEPIDPHVWENTPPEYGGPDPPPFDRWPTPYEREVFEEEADRNLNPQNYESEEAGEFEDYRKQFDIPFKEGYPDPFPKKEKPTDNTINVSKEDVEGGQPGGFEPKKWRELNRDYSDSGLMDELMKNKNFVEEDNETDPQNRDFDIEKTMREFENLNRKSARNREPREESEMKASRTPGTYYDKATQSESASPRDSSYQSREAKSSQEDPRRDPRQPQTSRPQGNLNHISTEDEFPLERNSHHAVDQGQLKTDPLDRFSDGSLDSSQQSSTQTPDSVPEEGVSGPPAEAPENASEEIQRPERPRKAEWALKEEKEIEERLAADRALAKEREAQMAAQGGQPQGYGPPRPRIQSAAEIRAQMAFQKLAMRALGAARKKGKKGRPAVMFI